jgi:hypothetical protein
LFGQETLTKTLLQQKPPNIKQGRRDLVLLKRTALAIALILALLVSAIAVVLSTKVATANPFIYLPIIVINSDGSVEPENDFIAKTGNIYTLTANLHNYVVNIQRSNIIFDGAGHIINGTLPSIEHGRWFSDCTGLSLEGVTNVTVRNIEITGFNDFDVVLENSRVCYFFKMKADDGGVLENSSSNLITECNLVALTEAVQPGVYLSSSNSNKFSKNDIEDIFLTNSNDNNFLENNFVIDNFPNVIISGKNVWDNSSVGNYWNDYLTKYPNASEIGNTGVGDTPYVIDAANIDHNPLMAPVDNTVPTIKVLSPASGTYNATSIQLSFTVNEFVSQIAYSLNGKENSTITGNITLTGLANGVHDLTIYAKDKAGNTGASENIHFNVAISEPFPVLPVAVASVATVVVVSVGLLVYFKKRKH